MGCPFAIAIISFYKTNSLITSSLFLLQSLVIFAGSGSSNCYEALAQIGYALQRYGTISTLPNFEERSREKVVMVVMASMMVMVPMKDSLSFMLSSSDVVISPIKK